MYFGIHLSTLIGSITRGIESFEVTPNSEILKKNGVDRINVSLDTLNPERFKEITRWGDVNKVLEGSDH